MANEVTVYRGQSYSREFTLTSGDAPFDLTGYAVYFCLRSTDGDVLLDLDSGAHPTKVVFVAPLTGGKFRLDLSPADTAQPLGYHEYCVYGTKGALLVPLVDLTSFQVLEGRLP